MKSEDIVQLVDKQLSGYNYTYPAAMAVSI